jgi:CRISPR-associated protein Cas6
MFWNEEETINDTRTPDEVVDILFTIDCKSIPVDHAHALSDALLRLSPWIRKEPGIAIHTIHVAGSQNGWERPAHSTDSVLMLSRRTRLTIRTPRHRIADLVDSLEGAQLNLAGHRLIIGGGKTKPLSRETTLFARYVVVNPDAADETSFLTATVLSLAEMDVAIQKALCGKTQDLAMPSGALMTRSLMLAGLTPEASLRLQRSGLGSHGLMGCGIFIPHKGIDSVQKT